MGVNTHADGSELALSPWHQYEHIQYPIWYQTSEEARSKSKCWAHLYATLFDDTATRANIESLYYCTWTCVV